MAAIHGLKLREPIASDWPAIAALQNLDSDETITPEEVQRRYHAFPKAGRRLYLVLEGANGTPVGRVVSSHRPNNGDGVYYASIEVDPAHRGKGFGAALYAAAHEFLEAEQAKVVTFFVRETDEVSLKFADKRGYVMDRVLAESRLDLMRFDLDAWTAKLNPDVELLTLNDLGDHEATWRDAHRVATESDDAPDIELWGAPSFEEFYEAMRNGEAFVPEGVILARIKGEFAGTHTTGPIRNSTGWTTDYTGVLPSFRRRGVATALKVFGIRQALAAGATWIMTHNDSSNTGMLAINRALGFVSQAGYAQMRKRVER